MARAMSPLLLDNRVLSFAEAVLGSAAQLDSFRVTCFPSLGPEHRGAVEMGGWHVDRFSHSLPAEARDWTPRRPSIGDTDPAGYCPPRAINCIGYLQDMDHASGPLRVVAGSHLNSVDYALEKMVPVGSKRVPLPHEQLVRIQAVLHALAVHCYTVVILTIIHTVRLHGCRSTVLRVTWWFCIATHCIQDRPTPQILTATLSPPISHSQRPRCGTSTLAWKGPGMISSATPYGSSWLRRRPTRATSLWNKSGSEGYDTYSVGSKRVN